MTEMVLPLSGAPKACNLTWNSIDWNHVKAQVYRLQMRIAKAFREGRHGKAQALQWILTHSFNAKLLAVKRVTSNQGAKTPGVDGVMWKTPKQKLEAAVALTRHGYQTKPLKRIYIPKKQAGKYRPLSIPVMHCRAQQALHLLSLEPIAETIADKNAYGFRLLRSTADALGQCFLTLCRGNSAAYVLEGDIKSCFDSISHNWLLDHVMVDKQMLRKWLSAGYLEKGELHTTDMGTPQGGIISPTLLNVTLQGLEAAVKSATKKGERVNVIVYADDFIITGKTHEVLESKVKPIVESFLLERGLELSQEKTKITPITEGFDFLGVNTRKYRNGKLIQKPAKDNVKKFLKTIRETIKCNKAAKTEYLIGLLNPKITGWANYHRHYCSAKTFDRVNHQIFIAIWQWARRRHRDKSLGWIRKKYFRSKGMRHWVLSRKIQDKVGKTKYLDLVEISHTPIRRHVKIKCDATPFDPAYKEYFDKRLERRKQKKLFFPCKSQWSPWWELKGAEN